MKLNLVVLQAVSFLTSAAVPLQWSANSAERIGHFLHFDIAGWQFQKKKSPQIFVRCSAFETFDKVTLLFFLEVYIY